MTRPLFTLSCKKNSVSFFNVFCLTCVYRCREHYFLCCVKYKEESRSPNDKRKWQLIKRVNWHLKLSIFCQEFYLFFKTILKVFLLFYKNVSRAFSNKRLTKHRPQSKTKK